MGVAIWPMVELEADDALASAAHAAAADESVQQVCIWTPDKDLAQCVRGNRVVQVLRKAGLVREEPQGRERYYHLTAEPLQTVKAWLRMLNR